MVIVVGVNLLGVKKIMSCLMNYLSGLGLEPKEEISERLKNERYPEEYNPIMDFSKKLNSRRDFINTVMEKDLLRRDISDINVVEIGGGICSTGAAFAEKCSNVVAFELEEIHCLYAKRCKEYYNIDNLAVFQGSILNMEGEKCYSIKDSSIDLVVSYMGMYKFTIMDSLEIIHSMLKTKGEFICVYPRFWTEDTGLNDIDHKLLSRALANNEGWHEFGKELSKKLKDLGFKVEYNGILEKQDETPIGGDIIIGSKIASSPEEYFNNPIEGIIFGKTPITCNTLVCRKV